MDTSHRQAKWNAWHRELCDRFPALRQHTPEAWADELGIAVEEIFADQTLPESERLEKAEQTVTSYYASELTDGPAAALRTCIANAVRLQVQEAFEQWKVEASTA